ncbi:MAG: hypothetical protein AB8B78_08800 [Polaribacter sp.]
MLKKIIAKPYLFLIIMMFLYGCPQAKPHKYKELRDTSNINENSIIKYQNDSIDVYLNYIHFFGNKKRNILVGHLTFLSNISISKNDYKIEINSSKFGVLENMRISKDYQLVKSHYHSTKLRKVDTNNIFRFQKIIGTKNSLRKIKKDTISIKINDRNTYLFKVPN